MIIYNSSGINNNLSYIKPNKLKTKRITNKIIKEKSSSNSCSKKQKLTKKNQLYLESIGLKLKK